MRIFRKGASKRGRADRSGSGGPPPNRKKAPSRREERSSGDAAARGAKRAKAVRAILFASKLLVAMAAAGATIWGGIQAYSHATTS
jgi:hypothetical protein